MTPLTETLKLAEQIYAVRHLESSYPCGRSGTQGGFRSASSLCFLTWDLGIQLCSTLCKLIKLSYFSVSILYFNKK